MAKKNIFDFLEMKRKGEKITFLPVNDYPFAHLAEQAGLDMLLVGDSLGMTCYGLKGTMPVTMDQMITHSQAVRRGAPNTFIVGDMPFGTYQKSVPDAIAYASRFFKEADVDCVKLEGGYRMAPQIKGLVDSYRNYSAERRLTGRFQGPGRYGGDSTGSSGRRQSRGKSRSICHGS